MGGPRWSEVIFSEAQKRSRKVRLELASRCLRWVFESRRPGARGGGRWGRMGGEPSGNCGKRRCVQGAAGSCFAESWLLCEVESVLREVRRCLLDGPL